MTNGVDTVSLKEITTTVVEEKTSDAVVGESPAYTVATPAEAETAVIETQDSSVYAEVTEQAVTTLGQIGPQGQPGEQGPEGPQGQPGPQGAPGTGLSPSVRVFVPIGGTAIVEALNASVIRSCKWIITTTATNRQQFRMSEILALNDGQASHHIEYGILGADVQYTADVALEDDSFFLRITNNDTEQLMIDAVRVGNLAT